MRRALLAASQGSAGLAVGEPDITVNDYWTGQRLLWTTANPASKAGTITSVKVGAYAGGPITVMTGTGSGTSFTVTATTGTLTQVAGANTFAVSLPIAAGGIMGIWSATTGNILGLRSGAASTFAYSTAAVSTAPTVGATFDGNVYPSPYALCLGGSGS